MSLKSAMRQAARQAPRLLGDSTALVRRFVRGQQLDGGGFRDRAGAADLYYTVFGLDALLALDEPFDAERLERWLGGFGAGEGLDLVHLSCLARCWSELPPGRLPTATRAALLGRLATFRAGDGGFALEPAAPRSTAYAGLLAFEAIEALGSGGSVGSVRSVGSFLRRNALAAAATLTGRAGRALRALAELRSADGAYGNERGMPEGTTTATAAAVALMSELGAAPPPEIAPWLRARCRPPGGFTATPRTPLPDLLSTATALHALAALGVPLEPVREPCLDFIDSLWSNEGGFHGHWADDALDVEYTFYGLLALGHLA